MTELTELLGRAHTLTILRELDDPKTVEELVSDSTVPQATVYRRIDELKSAGLVENVEGEATIESPQTKKKYTRCVSQIEIDLESEDDLFDLTLVERDIPTVRDW
jgi:DNA-binding transcriptional ArsR family regulator